MGYLFQVKIYEWPHFSIFSLLMTMFKSTFLLTYTAQKVKIFILYIIVYRSKFCTIKYMNDSLFFEGMIYEWVPFFDYKVYEWGMF